MLFSEWKLYMAKIVCVILNKEKMLLQLFGPCTTHPNSCQYPLINYLRKKIIMAA